jgi:hypothetical protein
VVNVQSGLPVEERLGTYDGWETPVPLQIDIQHGEAIQRLGHAAMARSERSTSDFKCPCVQRFGLCEPFLKHVDIREIGVRPGHVGMIAAHCPLLDVERATEVGLGLSDFSPTCHQDRHGVERSRKAGVIAFVPVPRRPRAARGGSASDRERPPAI